mmetsp:Transcript_127411/g.354666  ORF Transcript_127411/g.354666 Transcript_127411/m.354666 type:complete len:288 (+) Transcript_127411:404-1267(+)
MQGLSQAQYRRCCSLEKAYDLQCCLAFARSTMVGRLWGSLRNRDLACLWSLSHTPRANVGGAGVVDGCGAGSGARPHQALPEEAIKRRRPRGAHLDEGVLDKMPPMSSYVAALAVARKPLCLVFLGTASVRVLTAVHVVSMERLLLLLLAHAAPRAAGRAGRGAGGGAPRVREGGRSSLLALAGRGRLRGSRPGRRRRRWRCATTKQHGSWEGRRRACGEHNAAAGQVRRRCRRRLEPPRDLSPQGGELLLCWGMDLASLQGSVGIRLELGGHADARAGNNTMCCCW